MEKHESSRMKTIITSLAAVLAITTAAWSAPVEQVPAEKATLSYKELVKATRAATPSALLDRRVRINIRPFNGGSDAFYVNEKDMIGFVCETKAVGFTGGIVEATIIGYENQEDAGEFFTLRNCDAEILAAK